MTNTLLDFSRRHELTLQAGWDVDMARALLEGMLEGFFESKINLVCNRCAGTPKVRQFHSERKKCAVGIAIPRANTADLLLKPAAKPGVIQGNQTMPHVRSVRAKGNHVGVLRRMLRAQRALAMIGGASGKARDHLPGRIGRFGF
jgi:hypothetical protein